MTCPYCGSQNIQIHVVKKDKQARNVKVMLIALLVVFAFAFLLAILGDISFWLCVLISFIISMPTLAILKIILMLIPCGEKTVAVCCDCGEKLEK